MTIWAIADIHGSRMDPLTGIPSKPMDVFGEHWTNHLGRLQEVWKVRVACDDTVIVAGDIDWAVQLDDAMETLTLLDGLPGRKILLRGNHDYWWSSKTTSRVRRALPPTLSALHNGAFQVEGFNLCGTKGSPVPGAIDWTSENEKVLNRELHRLELSLEARVPDLPTIVALHYPPFYGAGESPYRDVLQRAGVSLVIYGHLHGAAGASGPRGIINGIRYRLVAGDAVGFAPQALACAGRLVVAADSLHPATQVGLG